jgi:putative nucleotidyltransferase with HDIG domain
LKKIMDDVTLAKGAARALRAHIERRRRELADSIHRALGETARSRPAGRSAFVGGLLDRLDGELSTGDLCATNAWVAETSEAQDSSGESIIGLSLAMLAASYAAERTDGHIAARYLALRGKQLDRIFEEGSQRSSERQSARTAHGELVESLLASLEARDGATCDHSRAVGMWAERIAVAMKMPAGERRFVGLAGTLHDIGKLATPKSILLKPGPLDEGEWETMREHSAVGARILERLPSLRECAPIVRAHHERVDGTGYPDHLRGSEVPIAARIVAVADAFHAMISDRPYRAAVPAVRALRILSEGKDVRWDSRSVEGLHAIVRPGGKRVLERAVGFED